jgi:predicted DNA-binding protein (MmcQ/YjbR family)
MNIESLRFHCLAKAETTESFPFDEDTLVFKVNGKIFALISLSEPHTVNLKCDPDYALELREHYPEVRSGYHMNKKHWNTVSLLGQLSNDFLRELIDHSYDCVVRSMPKKDQRRILDEE